MNATTHEPRMTSASTPPGAEEQQPRWAWSVGKIAGIPVYAHATFLALLAWIGLSHLAQGHGVREAFAGIALILAVFAIVVLHELGHALTARRYGIQTRHIILLPIGGIASLERMPERPREELLVALAGPAVNVVLAVFFFVAGGLAHHDFSLGSLHLVGGSFLTKLAWVNVSLAVFNLLPAFPMDGGRVLRALLATRVDRVRATEMAAACAQSLALLIGIFGLWTNPMLVVIAVFVWFGARGEASSVKMASQLEGLTVGDAMLHEYRALNVHDTVGDAAAHMLAGFQANFPVLAGNVVVGVLGLEDMVRALGAGGASTPVEAAMHRRFTTTNAYEPLAPALARLGAPDCDVLLVLDVQGALVGMLRLENIAELLALRAAIANGSAPEKERNGVSPSDATKPPAPVVATR